MIQIQQTTCEKKHHVYHYLLGETGLCIRSLPRIIGLCVRLCSFLPLYAYFFLPLKKAKTVPFIFLFTSLCSSAFWGLMMPDGELVRITLPRSTTLLRTEEAAIQQGSIRSNTQGAKRAHDAKLVSHGAKKSSGEQKDKGPASVLAVLLPHPALNLPPIRPHNARLFLQSPCSFSFSLPFPPSVSSAALSISEPNRTTARVRLTLNHKQKTKEGEKEEEEEEEEEEEPPNTKETKQIQF